MESLTIERHIVRPDGDERWYRGHCSVITTAIEKKEFYLGVMIDITNQKRQEKQIDTLIKIDEILYVNSSSGDETLLEVFQLLLKTFSIRSINLWRVEADQVPRFVLATPLGESTDEIQFSRIAIKAYLSGVGSQTVKWLSVNPDNSQEHSAMVIPIFIGEKLTSLVEVRPHVSTQLTQISEDFFKSISRRLSAYLEKREMNARLLQSAKLASLGEFAGSISHEINNPLTLVFGKACQVESLLKSGEFDSQILLEKATQIKFYSEMIVNIVTSLKNYSRTGLGQVYSITSSEKLISDAASFYREKFEAEGVEFVTEEFPVVGIRCQIVLIQNVLINLLENAKDSVLSDSKKEKKVSIGCMVADKVVTFFVRDNGSGVSKDLGQDIFKPFTSTKLNTTGTGLGLSISKATVESHRGRIWYDSNEKSTTFFFSIPE